MTTSNSKRRTKSDSPRTPNSSPEESERDLPLKVEMRRLFWSMGCSTRLDVKLRAYVAGDERGPGWQEFTDLDVLAVGFSPGGQVHLSLADCKTSKRSAIERMFWVRGVAEFFAADEAYLVRSQSVPAAARSLSTRIGVGVLDPDDYVALARTFPTELDLKDGPLRCLFDLGGIRRQANLIGLDRRLDSLIEFIRYDYWIYEPYRNVTQVIAHLAEAASVLEPKNPQHLSLFFDVAWLYAFALAQAAHRVRSSRMADVPTAVRTYVAGGELATREKAQLAELLKQMGIAVNARNTVMPPYIDPLIELVNRLLKLPMELGEVLRYAEYLTTAAIVGERATVGVAFGQAKVRPFAAQLLASICGFLVTSTGMRPEFRTEARERLVVDLTGGVPASRRGNESADSSVSSDPAGKATTPDEQLRFPDLPTPTNKSATGQDSPTDK